MPEHLTNLQIENLMARRLASGDLLSATQHLAGCADCRQRVNAQAKLWERVSSLQMALRMEGALAHLSYEQLVAYIENSADTITREIIVNHLEACSRCTFEAEELQALHENLTMPVAQPTRAGFIEWLRSAWAMPTLVRPLSLAALTAAVLLLVAFVWWVRGPAPTPAPQIAATIPSPIEIPASQPSPVAATAPAVVTMLNDNGRQIALDQAGNLTGFAGLSKDAEAALKQALATQKVEISPELKPLLRRPATLMSGTDEAPAITLHSPIGTFVKDPQPTLRWQAVKGAENYTVTVLDESFNVVATSPALAQTSWRATPSLKRGQEYLWQVTAEVEGKRVTSASARAPEAHFKILSAEKARGLQTTVQLHNSHLLRGTLYAKAGLLDEAEREYNALLKANPHSAIARKLLRNLRGVRE